MSLSDKLDKIIENQEKIISLLNRHEENHIILDRNQSYTKNLIDPSFLIEETGIRVNNFSVKDYLTDGECLKNENPYYKDQPSPGVCPKLNPDKFKNSWQNYL
jgi:hypothetical protein